MDEAVIRRGLVRFGRVVVPYAGHLLTLAIALSIGFVLAAAYVLANP